VVLTGGLEQFIIDAPSVGSSPLLLVVPAQRQRLPWTQILLCVRRFFWWEELALVETKDVTKAKNLGRWLAVVSGASLV
jgi:hypothetical protein